MTVVLYALTIAAALGSGLVAGIFFAFSTFIMQALGRIAPPAGIAAMQAINITVINPLFFAAFFGTVLIAALVVILALVQGQSGVLLWLVAGAVLYIFGCVGVTMAFNVPLNNALAPLGAESAEAAKLWARYLADWTWWNSVRTVASALAMLSFILALRSAS
jgi:uncharacterized membrane protein